MNESVQVINKNGDTIYAEGIAYMNIKSTGKKYLFYTLNEKVDNDLTKIYIAELGSAVGQAGAINQMEWEDLRNKMLSISRKQPVEDIEYMSMTGIPFYVGDPKKMAVTSVAKQAFSTAGHSYSNHTIQQEEPAVTGATSFFAQAPEVKEPITQPSETSIFANPPQPIETAQQTTQINSPVPQPISSNNINSTLTSAQSEGITPAPMPGPVQSEGITPAPMPGPVQSEGITPAPMPGPVQSEGITPAPISEPVQSEGITSASIPEPVQSEVITPAPMPASVQSVPEIQTSSAGELNTIKSPNSMISQKLISDEDALKAINIIQEYIEQEEKNHE